jgi:hypothetical protein
LRFQKGELVLDHLEFAGTLKGSGLLSSEFAIRQLKRIAIQTMQAQIHQILSRTETQEALMKGLMQWARFYTGFDYQRIDLESLIFYKDPNTSGIRYRVMM